MKIHHCLRMNFRNSTGKEHVAWPQKRLFPSQNYEHKTNTSCLHPRPTHNMFKKISCLNFNNITYRKNDKCSIQEQGVV